MALCRDGWLVVYEERAVAWTEAPASLWGTLAAAVPLVLRNAAGDVETPRRLVAALAAGSRRRGLTYLMLFQVLLPLLAPVVDVFAIYGLVFP